MEPCFQLSQLFDNLCCWGRKPALPLQLESFCETHSHKFLQYVLQAYFTHFVKLALFVSSMDTIYVVFPAPPHMYRLFAWRVTDQTPVDGLQPLHFKKTVSGTMELHSVLELLITLPCFQIYAILLTPLTSVAVVPNVTLTLRPFDVKNLDFNALYPAFMVPVGSFVPVDILSAPFVMVLHGSTTPDPRLYNSGTSSLWDTITTQKFPIQKLRYGLFLQSIKTMWSSKPFYSLEPTDHGNGKETDSEHQQFSCDL